jgi:hypothetical protein
MSAATEPTVGHGRLVAFRVLAGIGGALLTLSSIAFAVPSFVDEDDRIHVVHNIGGVCGYVLLMGVPLLLLAWRPRQVALLRLLVAAMLASLIGGLMSGDFFAGYAIPFVWIGVVIALAPDRGYIVRIGSPNLLLLAVPIASVVPAMVYAGRMADLQHGPASDPHVELHHWSGMAVTAILLVLAAAASSIPGRAVRTARLLAGFAGALLALGYLAFPNKPGSVDTVWAVALLLTSVVYLALAEVASGAHAPAPVESSPGATDEGDM